MGTPEVVIMWNKKSAFVIMHYKYNALMHLCQGRPGYILGWFKNLFDNKNLHERYSTEFFCSVNFYLGFAVSSCYIESILLILSMFGIFFSRNRITPKGKSGLEPQATENENPKRQRVHLYFCGVIVHPGLCCVRQCTKK